MPRILDRRALPGVEKLRRERFREGHDFSRAAMPLKIRRALAPLGLLQDVQGSALLEFAIALPLLVVLVVGIYDFSGAFSQKQKVEQAAQEGAIIAGAQPMTDIGANPGSLQAVATAVFNSLAGNGVVPTGSCTPPGTVANTSPSLTWIYTISGCSSAYPTDNLVITINRAWSPGAGSPAVVGTMVTVAYPYHWRFNRVIQLLFPGPTSYLGTTQVTESATVHNQM
ncbi:MAG: TadE/TadG family type IV pilus assembly protein [Terriglobales bacterium]